MSGVNTYFLEVRAQVLLWKSSLKIKIFRIFSPLKEALMVTFNEKCAPTSRKYVAKQDIILLNFL